MATTELTTSRLEELLGDEAESLLEPPAARRSTRRDLHLPGPDFVDRVLSTRPTARRRCCATSSGCSTTAASAGTGYVSILPVDQGIEHSAGASFAPNPIYFDPENIVRLAIEGGCNAVASTLGVLGAVAATYAHKIPFIVKLNHNELLTYPNALRPDHVRRRSQRACDMGAAGVGATIYFGSEESRRQIVGGRPGLRGGPPARHVHRARGATCATPPSRSTAADYHARRRPDRPGQPPRRDDRGRHHQAEAAREQRRLHGAQRRTASYGKTHKLVYERAHDRPPDRPHPLPGRQLLHGPRRRSSTPAARRRARPTWPRPSRPRSINKRAGGMGLISGRKAFQRPMEEGVGLLHAIQDVYLSTRSRSPSRRRGGSQEDSVATRLRKSIAQYEAACQSSRTDRLRTAAAARGDRSDRRGGSSSSTSTARCDPWSWRVTATAAPWRCASETLLHRPGHARLVVALARRAVAATVRSGRGSPVRAPAASDCTIGDRRDRRRRRSRRHPRSPAVCG